MTGATALDRYGWAIRAPIDDPTVWRTLVVLVDHSDDAGLAWPKVSTIAERTRRSYSTAQNSLDRLEQDGFIQRVRLRSGGKLRGYLFRVMVPGASAVDPDLLPAFATRNGTPDLPDEWLAPVLSTGNGLPVTTGNRLPVGYREPITGQEPPKEEPPSKERPLSSDLRPDGDYTDEVKDTTRQVAQMIRGAGHALPGRGSKAADGWLREMDRLLRLGPPGDTGDDPPPTAAEVLEVATWALTVSDFWPANIRSVPTLRKQWTRLRGQARAGRNGQARDLADGYAAAAQALRDRSSR